MPYLVASPMRIDGRQIARHILARTREALDGACPVVRAITVAPTRATESYLAIKSARAKDAGMVLEVVRLADVASTQEVIAAVTAPGADAVIVQLPLPASIDTAAVLAAIPVAKDADCLSPRSRIEGALLPPVAGAVQAILAQANVSVTGKRAVVIGAGWLVGEPVAAYLTAQGANVVVIEKTDDLATAVADANIIVSGAGSPHLVTPNLLKQGVVLIDAGTSESGGAVVGDVDPLCEAVAAVYTPVPGGVGPVAVACLFENVAKTVLSGTPF